MHFIDIGLSVEWADSNYGAQNPEEFGAYMSFFDAKKLKLPAGVRLPSYEELQELINDCKWNLVPDFGYMLKGCKVIGPNGNKIFLPAAGSGESTVGYGADFWSCESCDSMEAHSLHFMCGEVFTQAEYKASTYTLRMVKEKSKKLF